MIAGPELALLFGVLVLLFGASRIPKIARAVGQSLKEPQRGYRDAINQTEDN